MKNNKKLLSFALILILCLTVLTMLSSCNKDGNDGEGTTGDPNNVQFITEFPVYNGTAYAGKIIYAAGTGDCSETLAAALKDKFGTNPETATDTSTPADSATLEILIGSTNRTESAAPANVDGNDAWYHIGLVGNKLVINASNSYMLGLAVENFVTDFITPAQNSLTVTATGTKLEVWDDYAANGWILHELPYYKGEKPNYGMSIYESGKPLTEYANDSARESRELVVARTSSEEFLAYVDRLKEVGYTEIAREELGKNIYVTLQNDDHTVYTYLTANKRSVNIIIDYESATVNEISKPMTAEEVAAAKESGKSAVFYQYGLRMQAVLMPETGTEGYEDNGMMYIIKAADDSVIIVDGGYSNQADYAELNAFLREITGVADGEKVTIASWVVTHLHSDHVDGFKGFVNMYHDQIDLQSICANVPFDIASQKQNDKVNTFKTFTQQLTTWYPELKELQIHTGQKLQFGDVTVQALFTHEDATSIGSDVNQIARDKSDFNHTSSVYKIVADGMSLMILGDAQSIADDYLVSAYDEENLKCDIVQIAHHAFNGVTRVYDYVKASIYFVPQSYGCFQRTLPVEETKWDITIKRELLEGKIFPTYVKDYEKPDEMIFFAGKAVYTVGLQVVDGTITVVYEPERAYNRKAPDVVTEQEDQETQWGDIEFIPPAA